MKYGKELHTVPTLPSLFSNFLPFIFYPSFHLPFLSFSPSSSFLTEAYGVNYGQDGPGTPFFSGIPLKFGKAVLASVKERK